MTHLSDEILLSQASNKQKNKNKTEPTVSLFARVEGGKREAEPTFRPVGSHTSHQIKMHRVPLPTGTTNSKTKRKLFVPRLCICVLPVLGCSRGDGGSQKQGGLITPTHSSILVHFRPIIPIAGEALIRVPRDGFSKGDSRL